MLLLCFFRVFVACDGPIGACAYSYWKKPSTVNCEFGATYVQACGGDQTTSLSPPLAGARDLLGAALAGLRSTANTPVSGVDMWRP